MRRAMIVTVLIGSPEYEKNTNEYFERSNVRPQIQKKKKV